MPTHAVWVLLCFDSEGLPNRISTNSKQSCSEWLCGTKGLKLPQRLQRARVGPAGAQRLQMRMPPMTRRRLVHCRPSMRPAQRRRQSARSLLGAALQTLAVA